MAFSAVPVKARSLGLWSLVLGAASLGLGGCIIVDNDDHDDGYYYQDDGYTPPAQDDPQLVAIDTDAVIEAEPGEGVGLFVEYAAGGTWRIWTTCDTNYSKYICTFDGFLSVDLESDLSDLTNEALEGVDDVGVVEPGVAQFHLETGSDIDALTFVTTPGAVVRLETYLDGVAEPRFVYWFGEGVLHTGAPTNPVDFQPTSE